MSEMERIQQIRARHDEGQRYPTGSWAQRWLPRVCKHENTRCIHADEIIARRWCRTLCMVCGRAFKPLPLICWYTGKAHAYSEHP